jgi:hypothetical protein
VLYDQVLYDPSGVTKELHSRVAIVLGLWHPLKQLMLLTWKRYAAFFFAPLLHALVPGSRYHEKPKLLKLHAIFIAYPSVRENLRLVVSDERVNLAGRSLAENLIDLFEFYVILVRELCVIQSLVFLPYARTCSNST